MTTDRLGEWGEVSEVMERYRGGGEVRRRGMGGNEDGRRERVGPRKSRWREEVYGKTYLLISTLGGCVAALNKMREPIDESIDCGGIGTLFLLADAEGVGLGSLIKLHGIWEGAERTVTKVSVRDDEDRMGRTCFQIRKGVNQEEGRLRRQQDQNLGQTPLGGIRHEKKGDLAHIPTAMAKIHLRIFPIDTASTASALISVCISLGSTASFSI